MIGPLALRISIFLLFWMLLAGRILCAQDGQVESPQYYISNELGMALEEKELPLEETAARDIAEDEEQGPLKNSIDDLRLSVRSRKCLQKLNIHTIGDLIQTTEAELLGTKNFGVTSLNEIKKAINNLGLSLRSLD